MMSPCGMVNLGITGAWLSLAPYFIRYPALYAQKPVDLGFFPAALRHPWLFLALWLLPILSGLVAIRVPAFLRAQLGLWVACSLLLLWHQGSYNDATFVTSFWAGLWGLWFAGRDEADLEERRNGVIMAKAIFGMIFLGGALGKLTSGYWNGTVLFEIYFRDRDFWSFNLARSVLDAKELPVASMLYSRIIILSELAAVFFVLLPARRSFVFFAALATTIVLLSNWYLFSVMLSLLGLAAAGYRLAAPSRTPATVAR